MLDKKIRILNFDNSVTRQRALLSRYDNEIIDLTGLGAQARFWISSATRALVKKAALSSAKNSVTFLGSGDFHHISEILISCFDEPTSVIDFDLHPDWGCLPSRINCGSWVNEVLKQKNVSKIILIGASSRGLSAFDIQTGNTDSLKDDHLEIYPYERPPAKVFFKRIPSNVSLMSDNGFLFSKIYWTELKDKDFADFFKKLLIRIPTERVYISIDKDCLKSKYALTNWEEGELSLGELIIALKLIKQNKDIAGLDIVGDYSKIVINSVIKRFVSYLDHPRGVIAEGLGDSAITAVNEETNLKILEALGI